MIDWSSPIILVPTIVVSACLACLMLAACATYIVMLRLRLQKAQQEAARAGSHPNNATTAERADSQRALLSTPHSSPPLMGQEQQQFATTAATATGPATMPHMREGPESASPANTANPQQHQLQQPRSGVRVPTVPGTGPPQVMGGPRPRYTGVAMGYHGEENVVMMVSDSTNEVLRQGYPLVYSSQLTTEPTADAVAIIAASAEERRRRLTSAPPTTTSTTSTTTGIPTAASTASSAASASPLAAAAAAAFARLRPPPPNGAAPLISLTDNSGTAATTGLLTSRGTVMSMNGFVAPAGAPSTQINYNNTNNNNSVSRGGSPFTAGRRRRRQASGSPTRSEAIDEDNNHNNVRRARSAQPHDEENNGVGSGAVSRAALPDNFNDSGTTLPRHRRYTTTMINGGVREDENDYVVTQTTTTMARGGQPIANLLLGSPRSPNSSNRRTSLSAGPYSPLSSSTTSQRQHQQQYYYFLASSSSEMPMFVTRNKRQYGYRSMTTPTKSATAEGCGGGLGGAMRSTASSPFVSGCVPDGKNTPAIYALEDDVSSPPRRSVVPNGPSVTARRGEQLQPSREPQTDDDEHEEEDPIRRRSTVASQERGAATRDRWWGRRGRQRASSAASAASYSAASPSSPFLRSYSRDDESTPSPTSTAGSHFSSPTRHHATVLIPRSPTAPNPLPHGTTGACVVVVSSPTTASATAGVSLRPPTLMSTPKSSGGSAAKAATYSREGTYQPPTIADVFSSSRKRGCDGAEEGVAHENSGQSSAAVSCPPPPFLPPPTTTAELSDATRFLAEPHVHRFVMPTAAPYGPISTTSATIDTSSAATVPTPHPWLTHYDPTTTDATPTTTAAQTFVVRQTRAVGLPQLAEDRNAEVRARLEQLRGAVGSTTGGRQEHQQQVQQGHPRRPSPRSSSESDVL